MTSAEAQVAELGPETKAIINELRVLRGVESQGLSVRQQSDLWIKLGMGAASLLLIGGFGWIQSGISDAGEIAAGNSKLIDNQNADIKELTTNVNRLVLIVEGQERVLGQRGNWMEGVDLYSEQSRMADQKHDSEINSLRAAVERLEAAKN